MNKISPHVTIYKFPIGAISSICNRISGLYLSGLFVLYGNSCLINKNKLIDDIYLNLNDYKKKILQYTVLIPVNYHTLGGIRHFIFDSYPKYLNNTVMNRSSYYIFGITIINSIIMENSLKYFK